MLRNSGWGIELSKSTSNGGVSALADLEVDPMERKVIANDAVNSLLAEMVLDEAIRVYRKHTLYREIDRALQQKNKDAFLALTAELKSLLSA